MDICYINERCMILVDNDRVENYTYNQIEFEEKKKNHRYIVIKYINCHRILEAIRKQYQKPKT